MLDSQVRDLEERRWSAQLIADTQALDELLAEDLVWTHASGRVDGKQSYIASLRSGQLRFVSAVRSVESVAVIGDTALVHGTASLRVQTRGATRAGRTRYLAVWHRYADRVQMLAWHSTLLAEGG